MIKNHLSKLLGERRWTQADLARKTGIRRATINELYNELTDRVNLEHLDRICEVLECSVSDVLEYVPNPQRKTGADLIIPYQELLGNYNSKRSRFTRRGIIPYQELFRRGALFRFSARLRYTRCCHKGTRLFRAPSPALERLKNA